MKTWKQKYNKKYGNDLDEPNSLTEISKKTGVSKKGLQKIFNKGVGAYKNNPESVRPNVKSKEQWAQARVYSAVMGGKASKIDKKELKMEKGGKTKKNYSFIEVLDDDKGREIIDNIEWLSNSDKAFDDKDYYDSLVKQLKDDFGYEYSDGLTHEQRVEKSLNEGVVLNYPSLSNEEKELIDKIKKKSDKYEEGGKVSDEKLIKDWEEWVKKSYGNVEESVEHWDAQGTLVSQIEYDLEIDRAKAHKLSEKIYEKYSEGGKKFAKGGKIDTDFLSYKVIQILQDREIESEERIDEAIDYVFSDYVSLPPDERKKAHKKVKKQVLKSERLWQKRYAKGGKLKMPTKFDEDVINIYFQLQTEYGNKVPEDLTSEQVYEMANEGYSFPQYSKKASAEALRIHKSENKFAKGGLTREYIKPKGIKLLDDDRKQKIKEAEKEYDRKPNDINQAKLQSQIDRAVDEVENRVMGIDGKYESYLVRYAKGGEIGIRFELGSPVNYRTEDYSGNERIESGEVVLRDGKKAIKLYNDMNYSGGGERIRFFDEIDMSQVKNFSDSTYAEGGEVEYLSLKKEYDILSDKNVGWFSDKPQKVERYEELRKSILPKAYKKAYGRERVYAKGGKTYAEGGEVKEYFHKKLEIVKSEKLDSFGEDYYVIRDRKTKQELVSGGYMYMVQNLKSRGFTSNKEVSDIISKAKSVKGITIMYSKGGSTYAEGGEIGKKGNEMLIGGLAGILLGIFLNK